MISTKPQSRPKNQYLLDRILGILAILTVILAYFFGLQRSNTGISASLELAMPTADRFESISDTIYTAYKGGGVVGFVGIGKGMGFNGPIRVAVGFDLEGKIVDYTVLEHYDTPEYFHRIEIGDLKEILISKSYLDPLKLGEDVDSRTGASFTTMGILDAIRKAGSDVAANSLELGVPIGEPLKVEFGIPEFALIALFGVGFFAHRHEFKFKKIARWASMITGMLMLGFWLNQPLTISKINQLLLGFFPPWQTNLYWYLLIGGILFVFTAENKNPYCEWFCPFGAAQECLAAVGGAKVRSPGNYRSLLKWLQRGLAWLAVVSALYFRNPGISSYEIFGTLFKQIGSTVSFAVLGIVLVASLYIKRPWCTYLCPLRPVVDFVRLCREWIFELWKKISAARN